MHKQPTRQRTRPGLFPFATVAMGLLVVVALSLMTQKHSIVSPPVGVPAAVNTTGEATATYSTDVLNTMVVDLVHQLGTASPIPSIGPDRWERGPLSELWDKAQGTVVALYPPPRGYDPVASFTPDIPLTPWPTEPIYPAGSGYIYEDGWNVHFASLMVTANNWHMTVGNQTTIVYAGREGVRGNREQGVVLVAAQDPITYEITSGPDLYETPVQAGIVRIIDAVGDRLTLRAENGTLFYFDVTSRQWVNP